QKQKPPQYRTQHGPLRGLRFVWHKTAHQRGAAFMPGHPRASNQKTRASERRFLLRHRQLALLPAFVHRLWQRKLATYDQQPAGRAVVVGRDPELVLTRLRRGVILEASAVDLDHLAVDLLLAVHAA